MWTLTSGDCCSVQAAGRATPLALSHSSQLVHTLDNFLLKQQSPAEKSALLHCSARAVFNYVILNSKKCTFDSLHYSFFFYSKIDILDRNA